MAIITKPSILKGVAASVSLSKSELSALSVVSSDSYFSDQSNWEKVLVFYKSTIGKQIEVLSFDAAQSTPTANFLVSTHARDNFEVQKIMIMDFDSGSMSVSRSDLTAAGINVASVFDVSFSVGGGGGGGGGAGLNYIVWDHKHPQFTTDTQGGLTMPSVSAGWGNNAYSVASATTGFGMSGAVTYTFNLSLTGSTEFSIGISANEPNLSADGYSSNAFGIYRNTNNHYYVSIGSTYMYADLGENTNPNPVLKIEKDDMGVVKVYVDAVSFNAGIMSDLTVYPKVSFYSGAPVVLTSSYKS